MDLNDFEKSRAIWSARTVIKNSKTEKDMLKNAADILREIAEAIAKWRTTNDKSTTQKTI